MEPKHVSHKVDDEGQGTGIIEFAGLVEVGAHTPEGLPVVADRLSQIDLAVRFLQGDTGPVPPKITEAVKEGPHQMGSLVWSGSSRTTPKAAATRWLQQEADILRLFAELRSDEAHKQFGLRFGRITSAEARGDEANGIAQGVHTRSCHHSTPAQKAE